MSDAIPPPMAVVGEIDFLNCYPLKWGLEATGAASAFRILRDTPDKLSAALVDGRVDVGPISLIEALAHADDLIALPEVAVYSEGAVQSVCLVSRVPLAELTGRVVALGSTSRTSVRLAQVLLRDRYHVEPQYITHEPDLQAMLGVADAAVLIGDPALRVHLDLEARGDLITLDLGQAWWDWTASPMVFAVWAARRSWAVQRPQALRTVRLALRDALTTADDHRGEVADAAHGQATWADAASLRRYFEAVRLDPGPSVLRATSVIARRLVPNNEPGLQFAEPIER